MRVLLHFGSLLFIAILFSLPAAAQEADSAWFIKWHRYVENPDGTVESGTTEELTMWLSDNRARLYVNSDRYIGLTDDSIYVIDIYNKIHTSGLISNRNLIHIKKDFTRHRRVAPPPTIQETSIKKTMMGYETTQLIVDLVANQKFMPLKVRYYATDQHPLPDSLLRMYYNAVTFIDMDVSIDFIPISDSLYNRGVLPMMWQLRANLPMNTAGWLNTEIVAFERVVVPESHFLPPVDSKHYELQLPTEEDIWMATSVPMPGGPRKKK